MKAPKFERNKLLRLLRTHGISYTFKRSEINKFKEPTGEAVSVATIQGVFHETTQHVSIVASDAASVKSKQTPYILTLYEAAKDLQQGDYTIINGKTYTVNDAVDIGNFHIAVDISLEVTV